MIRTFFLIPSSILYFFIIHIRNFFYNRRIFKQYKINALVISVGNITWGGTGKTPAVLFLHQAIASRGKKTAVLLRGYGKDEEKFLLKMAPGAVVAVGKDRVKSGKTVLSECSLDAVLLDDGFQYRRLERDLDIVCIDAVCPFGNRLLIPAGPMREPVSSLKRADIFLLTKTDLVKDKAVLNDIKKTLKRINPDALVVMSIHRPKYFYRMKDNEAVGIEQFKGKEAVLISGIGGPEAFERTIQNLGITVKKHFMFRDHHWYSEKDLEKVNKYCVENNINTIVTTEKDAVRLPVTLYPPLITKTVVLAIGLKITENENELYNRLFRIFDS